MSLSTIILESGGVFAHNTNQDGSGNIGVNVENTPTVVISGTPSVSVSNFPSSQAVTSPDLTTSGLGDTGTYTASFAGTSHTNSNAKGALIGIILGTVSGTNVNLELDLQWSPDDGTTWVSMGILRSSTFTAA